MAAEHDRVSPLLGVYAVGACDPVEVAEVKAHAARCPTCAEEVTRLEAVIAWLDAGSGRSGPP